MSPSIEHVGGWLFKHRTSLPIPIALVLLIVPAARMPDRLSILFGSLIVGAGEALRLWGVHHIGVISRTRSDRLGPLVDTGPFALVRNPLYIGNVALWTGFTVAARLYWLVPLVIALLAFEYHAIVRWEERLLTARIGDPYREYTRRIARWLPRPVSASQVAHPSEGAPQQGKALSWRATLYSERGTLIAIIAGFLLLYLKDRVLG